jgi:hypothetical protein
MIEPPLGYFTVADTVKLLPGVSERDIRRAVAAGHIGCIRISPRRSWISWEDVSAWREKTGCR